VWALVRRALPGTVMARAWSSRRVSQTAAAWLLALLCQIALNPLGQTM